ncbi:hypothetical protein [Actinomadura rudentiformis]|uniref:Teichoic acid biosynthesis protein C n=1 Tax=Actinomadura rudentiformis TaxID=359158 RepID=A0A6H9YZJ0_9ACTN|nr:hypothetical protein [Actinomadura rudentiformis]KAB2346859.1 hypothetical protein F8566_21845 [Actinomadura rudentiformis]
MHEKQWNRRRVLTLGGRAAAAVALGPLLTGTRTANASAGSGTAVSRRFDLSGSVHSLLWNKAILPGTVIQSFGFDDLRGHLYFVQVLDEAGAAPAGRLHVTRTDMSGNVLGDMILRDRAGKGWGHGMSLAVESTPGHVRLWIEVDGAVRTDGLDCTGRALARIPFVDGATFTPDSAGVEKHTLIRGATEVTCALDPVNNRLVQRYVLANRARYAVYSLNEVIAGRYHPVAWFAEPMLSRAFRPGLPSEIFVEVQGYAAYDRHLYILAANLQDEARLTAVDLRSGRTVQRRSLDSGPSSAFPHVYRKAEGMAIQQTGGSARLCHGFAGGDPGIRTTTISYLESMV